MRKAHGLLPEYSWPVVGLHHNAVPGKMTTIAFELSYRGHLGRQDVPNQGQIEGKLVLQSRRLSAQLGRERTRPRSRLQQHMQHTPCRTCCSCLTDVGLPMLPCVIQGTQCFVRWSPSLNLCLLSHTILLFTDPWARGGIMFRAK